MTVSELANGNFPLVLKIISVVVMIIIFGGVYFTFRQLKRDNFIAAARLHDSSHQDR
jgi:hypothetical protein